SIYYKREDWQNAIETYRNAIKYYPEDACLHYNLGRTYQENGQTERAIDQYREAISINGKNADFYNYLGISLYEKRDYKEAIENFNKAIKLEPDSAIFYYNLGNAIYFSGDFKNSIDPYKKAVSLSPNDFSFHSHLGVAYIKIGLIEEGLMALENARKVATSDKQIEDINNIIAKVKGGNQGPSPSVTPGPAFNKTPVPDVQTLSDEDKMSITQSFNNAEEFEKNKKWDMAIFQYKKILKLDKDNILAYHRMAIDYYRQKKYDDAIKNFNKVIELDSKGKAASAAHYSLANVYLLMGNKDNAIKEFELYLQVNPDADDADEVRAKIKELKK
ncbi:MAG: tetratricopeptide repeat protein, partial [Candidatus Eremiobacterota bacterium]